MQQNLLRKSIVGMMLFFAISVALTALGAKLVTMSNVIVGVVVALLFLTFVSLDRLSTEPNDGQSSQRRT